MKPVRVLNSNIELQAVIGNYESLWFTRSWSGVGELNMTINRYKNGTHTLLKDNIIVVGEGLEDTHKAYVIIQREIGLDEGGRETENWVIHCKELKSITNRRLILPPEHTGSDNRSGPAETVMKHYVNNHVVNPLDPLRKIPEVLVRHDLERGPRISQSLRLRNLEESLSDMSMVSGIGWGISVDYSQLKLAFECYEGKDSTYDNGVNNPVIFSPGLGNIKSMRYLDSNMNYKNVAYVAGQGEGVERRIITVGTDIGLDRYETFVDARDVDEFTGDDPPIPRPEGDIIRDLTNRGDGVLVELTQEEFLETQITDHNVQGYETRWDLGDIVVIENRGWNLTNTARITEVKEIYEPGGFQLEATFGNKRPNIYSKIKQEITGLRVESVR